MLHIAKSVQNKKKIILKNHHKANPGGSPPQSSGVKSTVW